MTMPKLKVGLNAGQFCEHLGKLIKYWGPDAYRTNDYVLLYTGPSNEIQKLLGCKVRNNWMRTADEVLRTGATRIEDTFVGKYLNSLHLKDYFVGWYGGRLAGRTAAEDIVWGFASERFVSGKISRVTTMINGSDDFRVLRGYEVCKLVDNPHVKEINERMFQPFREIHACMGDYVMVREVVKTELDVLRARVRAENTPDAWVDLREQLLVFKTERRLSDKRRRAEVQRLVHGAPA